jgi:acyl-CoA thioester hydrolase
MINELDHSAEVATVARVRYADTDKMGVAYYANYLVWFEVGRGEWLRARGSSYRELEDRGIVLPVIKASCEYRRPLRYDDEVKIVTRGVLLSPVRVEFHYSIARRPDGAVVAAGRTTHAATDASGRPMRLPEDVRSFFR